MASCRRRISPSLGVRGMSNTGRIAIDDNAVMRKFNRRYYIELGLTEYYLLINQYYSTLA